MKFSDLNETERAVLVDLVRSSAGNGNDFGFTDDATSVEPSQRGAYVASLSKKGYLDVEFGYQPENEHMFVLTERGLEFAASLI